MERLQNEHEKCEFFVNEGGQLDSGVHISYVEHEVFRLLIYSKLVNIGMFLKHTLST